MKKARAKTTQPDRLTTVGNEGAPRVKEFLTQGRALFLIIASTLLVYGNSLSGAFVFDDTKQIVGNPALRSWSNILHAFTNDVWALERGTLTRDTPPPYYRPLFTAYLTINYQLFGTWEPGWHLVNLFVHTGATITVFFFIKRLSGDLLIAMIAALLFGLHPVHVESVSWISGIPDPLAALFYVPAAIWYVRYRTEGGRIFLWASVIAYGLSALCKETPLALPLVFIVWELSRVRSPTVTKGERRFPARLREIIPQLIPYAVVASAYLLVRFSVLGRISWKHPFMAQVPDYAIWMTVPYVVLSYLRHLIAPFYLSLIYAPSFVTSAADPRFLVPVAVLVIAAVLLWTYRRKLSRDLWISLALIVAPLLPVLNLRVFHFEYIVQDRYLYLPSIGFCYLVAILIMKLSRHQRRLAIALGGAIVIAFGASTFAQNRIWHDAVALWQRAVSCSPNASSTHYNLGLAYLNLKQYDAALTQLSEAKRLNPREPSVLNNLAIAQNATGQKDEAITSEREALQLDPTLLEGHNNLGTFLFERGMYEEAQREFSELLARDPSSLSARFNLARALAAMGDHTHAIQEFAAVLSREPNDTEARYRLASSYMATNHRQEAIAELTRALQTDQDQKRSIEMRKKLELIQRSQ